MTSLRDLTFVNLNENVEVGKLLFLYNSNMLTNAQKKSVVSKVLTNSEFIISAVEKHNSELEKFKYGREVFYLYDILVNYNEDRLSTNINEDKLLNYYDNMDRFTNGNFNGNDIAFLSHIIYHLLQESRTEDYVDTSFTNMFSKTNLVNDIKKPNKKSVENVIKSIYNTKFNHSTTLQKMVGYIRINEFNMDIIKYTKDWHILNNHGDNYVILNDVYNLLDCKTSQSPFTFAIKLTRDYKFQISKEKLKYVNIWEETNIFGCLFEYNDKYYVGSYRKVTKIKNNNFDFSMFNIYGESAILPYIRGEIDYVRSYGGKIVYGQYIKDNLYENFPKIPIDLEDIIKFFKNELNDFLEIKGTYMALLQKVLSLTASLDDLREMNNITEHFNDEMKDFFTIFPRLAESL